MGKNMKERGSYKIFSTIIIIVICICLLYVTHLNKTMQAAEGQRVEYLVSKEQMKELVAGEIIRYLSVVDDKTWDTARGSKNLSQNAKNQVYTNSFTTFSVPNVTEYRILDLQYTMESEDTYKVYVNTLLRINGNLRSTVFLASIVGDSIENIEVY